MGSCMSTNASGGDLRAKPIPNQEESCLPTIAHERDGESDDGTPSLHSHHSMEARNVPSKPVYVTPIRSSDALSGRPSGGGITPCASNNSIGSVPEAAGISRDASTADMSMGEASSVGSGAGSNGDKRDSKNPKTLGHSSSIIGLDSMIENRREEGGLRTNVVHMEVPFGKPIEEVYDGVHTGPVLGHGISGLVRLVTHKATGVKYAVKCLDLSLVDTDDGLIQLREEIFIMCQLDHPNIVRLEEVYESHTEIYLVQELCLGGELFDRLDEQPDYHYTEAECARLIKQMLCAVRYLHSKGIIHRDLKLENFLFSSTAKDSELKMIDFGLSKHFRHGEVQCEAVGTPYTVAPEVIRGSYDERCDIWAIGVISFLLLSGEPPFGGCGGPEPLLTVRSNILSGVYEFEPEEIWSSVSRKAKQFIQALLVTDPKDRPTARDAQKHTWLVEWADKERSEDDNVLNPNVVKALVTFKEFSDMRKLLCEVLSFTLLPDQIKDLRKEFEKMDTDGSGEISLSALKQVLVTNAGAGSLGALTEEEVEDIFNAMRVKKTETRIVWHEFIAAGLSQCQVDDRNLRLAFERLDNDHKGYVTLDDIMDLVGNDALHSEETMRKMWVDSMKAVNCNQTRITYGDFLLLMKGQTHEATIESDIDADFGTLNSSQTISMLAVPDVGTQLILSQGHEDDFEQLVDVEQDVSSQKPSPFRTEAPPDNSLPLQTMPLSPILSGSAPEFDVMNPLSMDEDEDFVVPMNHSMSPKTQKPVGVTTLNAGEGPALTVVGLTSPLAHRKKLQLPPLTLIPRPDTVYVRKRSRSMDDECDALRQQMGDQQSSSSRELTLADAVPIQEREAGKGRAGTEGSKTATNRQMFLAHRQMRTSVLEASKQFEENRARHAREYLIAQREKAEGEGTTIVQAGLVMRRGRNKQISSESIKRLLESDEDKQQKLVEKAHRRCGRGRRSRKKTISDMSGMIVSLTEDDSKDTSPTTLTSPTPEEVIEPQTPPDETDITAEVLVPDDKETNVRGATVPGDFRKVQDPFGANGRYRAHCL